MAKYRFQCEKCSTIIERYASVETEALSCKECSGRAKRLFPNIGSKKVTEKVDPFLNINHEEDHKRQLEDRRTEYFWEVEVPRFVQSGIYSTETMLAEGWIVYNEKGELVIGKPKKKSK
jgi:hypothetical protein